MSSPAPSPATVIAGGHRPRSAAEGSAPQPPASAASAGVAAPPAAPPPALRLQSNEEEHGIVPRANITVVSTVDELVRATEERAQDIEIRSHLDLRTLDGRLRGSQSQQDGEGPLEHRTLFRSLLVLEPPTRSIRARSSLTPQPPPPPPRPPMIPPPASGVLV